MLVRWKRVIRWTVLSLGAMSVIAAVWTAWTLTGRYQRAMYTPALLETVPSHDVAVVFGAGYWPSGALSAILQDRIDAAIELYESGRVTKLLFSGDNRFVHYNEPGKMQEYALRRGVPYEDIVLDYAGRRTYDTCYRARDIFELSRVVLVTQRYHLPRALNTCAGLGIEVVGYIADRQPYPQRNITWYWLREIPALWRAWLDVNVLRPLPVLGEPLPILAADSSLVTQSDTSGKLHP